MTSFWRFLKSHIGWVDGWINGWMDGSMDGFMNRWMDGGKKKLIDPVNTISRRIRSKTNLTEFRYEMRFGDLRRSARVLVSEILNRLLNVIVSCSWPIFAQIQPISQKFNLSVTDLRTDRPRDTSYRDARTRI